MSVTDRTPSDADRLTIHTRLGTATGKTITDRLRKLKPAICLEKHIILNNDFVVKPSLLEGVEFEPVNSGKLYDAVSQATDFTGQKAFTDPVAIERDHWPLKISMLATKGVGFREVGRAVLAEPIRQPRQAWEKPRMDLGFGSQFSTTTVKLDVSSMHWAVSPDLSNIHIDNSGFTMQIGADIAVGPNLVQHIIDELLRDKLIKALPGWAGSVIRRITLIYPSTANEFSRWGPRLNETPILKKIAELPTVGGVLGKVPLPGFSFDILRGKNYKLSYTYSCGVKDGGCSHTLNLEGVF